MLAIKSPGYNDDLLARNNLDPRLMDKYINDMEIDDNERTLVARQLYYEQYKSNNVAPTMPLLDAVKVYQFLKNINERSKKKAAEGLNDWD